MALFTLTVGGVGQAIYEVDGEGGNVFNNITIAPSEGYLIGSNADGFHSTDVATGPTLSNSQLMNIENDFFSTHATMHIAVPLPVPKSHNFLLVDPREYAFGTAAAAGTIDEYYGTATPLNHVVNGTDVVSCYDFNSFAPIGQSVIGELREVFRTSQPLTNFLRVLQTAGAKLNVESVPRCVCVWVCACVLCMCTFQITDATFIKNFLAKASPDAASGINNMGVHLSPKMQSWTSVKLWNVTYV